jgi:hypothetical protein
METVSEKFMAIPPRHRRALEMLVEQKQRDRLGALGRGALREEDEGFTLEQIVEPLWERGLIEDLTGTELGDGGKYFLRITPLGQMCLGMGVMLRETRKPSAPEQQLLTAEMRRHDNNPYDPNEEKEAIA